MAKQEQKKPNILVIWGDDIGISPGFEKRIQEAFEKYRRNSN